MRGVLDREKAAMGVLISLQPPTGPMEAEAASAGFYTHKTNAQQYPRLQLRTVKQLMEVIDSLRGSVRCPDHSCRNSGPPSRR